MKVFIFFLGGGLCLHGSFSDIGVDQEFQKPEFVMPELLLKELWYFTATLNFIIGQSLHKFGYIISYLSHLVSLFFIYFNFFRL